MDDQRSQIWKTIKANGKKVSCTLGDITYLVPIGEGGNSLVYKGQLHGKPVAIKLFVVPTDQQKLLRFKAEFLNVQLLPKNNCVVSMVGFETIEVGGEEYPAIIMKCYDGQLKRPAHDAITDQDVDAFFTFLARAVRFLHGNGIIHRDLKPANILREGDRLVVTDFGIAFYNPSIFELRAATDSDERIGNRLFSAPEQGNSGTPAHETMDIFAIGQLVQWYVTGRTHHGTGRQGLTTVLPGLAVLDAVVDRCLRQKPAERFQTVDEMLAFLKQSLDREKERDPYQVLEDYGDVCTSTCPQGPKRVTHLTSPKLIDRLLTNLATKVPLRDELEAIRGQESERARFRQVDGKWLMGPKEIHVTEAWVYYDQAGYGDLILIKCASMEKFGVYAYAEGESATFEEAGLVDGKTYVTAAEYDNNYAEIEGEVVNITGRCERRVRYFIPRTHLITTRFHCAYQGGNADAVEQMVARIDAEDVPVDEILNWAWRLRKHKHEEIVKSL